MMRGLAYALALIASGAAAAELSPAELAAKTQRPITEQENALRQAGCVFDVTPEDVPVEPAAGVTGRFVTLPKTSLLISLQMDYAEDASGRFDSVRKPELPNGGIGGKDLCGPTQVFNLLPLGPGNPTFQWIGLRLRSNLDLEAEYPNTFQAIDTGAYLLTIPGGRYATFDGADAGVIQWWQEQGRQWGIRRGGRRAFTIGQRLFIHVSN